MSFFFLCTPATQGEKGDAWQTRFPPPNPRATKDSVLRTQDFLPPAYPPGPLSPGPGSIKQPEASVWVFLSSETVPTSTLTPLHSNPRWKGNRGVAVLSLV